MLEKKVISTIKKYNLIKKNDKIVVGVSGGPDSMALLNVLINIKEKFGFEIIVAHINHGLRQEADSETEFVKAFCNKNNINCYIKKEKVDDLAKKSKVGTEEAGRKLRYDFFDEILEKEKANKIATAHNENDNAETVLMNIIRGSGISGLKGIEPIRNEKIIRPLIECNREEIEDYCVKEKLNPKYDKSNNENTYTRNKVRNELIPFIKEEFNPNIISSINRLSKVAMEENEFLNKLTINAYERLKIKEAIGKETIEGNNMIIISLKEFNKLDLVIKNRLVLYTINKLLGNAKDIEMINIADIIKLCNNNIGNKYLLPNKNVKVFVNKGKIFFIKI